MKRRDLIRKIEEAGAIVIRHGGKHDWYQHPKTEMTQPVRASVRSTKCSHAAS